MARKKITRRIRFGVQALFLVLVVFKAIQHMVGDKGTFASLDGLCPLGGVETLGRLLGSGRYLEKLAPSNIILAVGLLISALVAGGVFCGWICPFGTLSDWFTALRRKAGIPEVRLPARLDRWLRYLRYVVLLAVLSATFYAGTLAFANYDPYRTVFSLHWIFEPSDIAISAVLITALTLLAMFFIPRAWCRYACPLGGVLSLVGRFRILRVARREEGCTHCAVCDRSCPMGLSISESEKKLSQCNTCLECVNACPAPEVLTVSAGRRRPVGQAWPVVAGIGVMVIAVAASMAAGIWVSSQRQTVQRLADAGTLSPQEIRGWMTFADVEKTFGVPVEYLLEALGRPEGFGPDTPLRELEQAGSDEDVDVIRTIVADYLKKQDSSTPRAVPPVPAESLSGANDKTTREPAGPQESAETEEAEPEVRGSMTLEDVAMGFGIPLEKLIGRLGLPESVDLKAALRDIKDTYGFDMATVRALVEELRTK